MAKPNPNKWSKKEVLGHLIDSATHNHHRFIRAQFEASPHIVYAQNEWNRASRYQSWDTEALISFWEAYNRHLLALLRALPHEALSQTCEMGEPQPVSLAWVAADYVRHMEHHLRQISPDLIL